MGRESMFLPRGVWRDEVFSAALSPETHGSVPLWHKMDPNLGHKARVSEAGGITFLQDSSVPLSVHCPFCLSSAISVFFICFVSTVLSISLMSSFPNRPLHTPISAHYQCLQTHLLLLITFTGKKSFRRYITSKFRWMYLKCVGNMRNLSHSHVSPSREGQRNPPTTSTPHRYKVNHKHVMVRTAGTAHNLYCPTLCGQTMSFYNPRSWE